MRLDWQYFGLLMNRFPVDTFGCQMKCFIPNWGNVIKEQTTNCPYTSLGLCCNFLHLGSCWWKNGEGCQRKHLIFLDFIRYDVVSNTLCCLTYSILVFSWIWFTVDTFGSNTKSFIPDIGNVIKEQTINLLILQYDLFL